ncbi:MAG: GntR family transcriptional regulator [Clostridiales bacterium]|jgi:DNA-binding GntR family transcriptional regulator|nr:GntR family transcriptional regulator [Clostridiales bacterium]
MVDHNSNIPLYQQLANILETAMHAGEYKQGSKLPSESKLCKEHGISRITVRQAFALLEQKGLAYAVQGKGTFSKMPVLDQQLMKIVKFGRMLEDKGLQGHSQVLSFKTKVQDPKYSALMQTKDGEPLCRMEIIGCAQGKSIVYYCSHLLTELGSRMYAAAKRREQKKEAFSTFDLYDEVGQRISKIDQTIRAVNAGRRIAGILSVRKNTALIVLESIVTDEYQCIMEHKMAYYCSDKYSFHVLREM